MRAASASWHLPRVHSPFFRDIPPERVHRRGSAREILPVPREDERGQYKADDHVDNCAGTESEERLSTGACQFAKARGQSDAEEAKNESPGPQVFDRRHQPRPHALVEIGKAVRGGHGGQEQRSDQKADNEFGKTAPDFRGLRLAAAFRPLPLRGRNNRQDERPDADPHIAVDHRDERVSKYRLTSAGGIATCQPVESLSGRESRGVSEFRSANPRTADAGGQMQPVSDKRQHEDHSQRPDDHGGYSDRRVLLFGANRPGNGNGGGN